MTEAKRIADTLQSTLTGKDPGLHIETCLQAIAELRRLGEVQDAVAAERERVRTAIVSFPNWLDPQAKQELLAALYESPQAIQPPKSCAEPVKLEEIEQYRMQMAGISTAALGYWKEGDGIHPDYDTPALRDVAKLYADYTTAPPQARPALTPNEILRIVTDEVGGVSPMDPLESLDWINIARAIEAAHGIGEA